MMVSRPQLFSAFASPVYGYTSPYEPQQLMRTRRAIGRRAAPFSLRPGRTIAGLRAAAGVVGNSLGFAERFDVRLETGGQSAQPRACRVASRIHVRVLT